MRVLFLFCITMSLLLVACNFPKKEQNDLPTMEELMHTTLDTLMYISWNKRDLIRLNELTTENISRRVNSVVVANNRNEVKANMNVIMTGFPDLILTLNHSYFSGNNAFIHWTLVGTNTGIYGEFPATSKKIKVDGVSKIQFDKNGKINSEDVFYNELDLLQQLGYTLIPPNLK